MKKIFRMWWTILLAGFLLTTVFLVCSENTSRATLITVDSTGDAVGSDGQCTLRGAIANANGDSNTDPDCATGSGDDVITFSLSSGSVISITGSALVIQTDDGTTIDGDLNDDGVPDIIVADANGADNSGILIKSSNNRVEGLIIRDFEWNGIYVQGSGNHADGNEIVNCYIGTDGASDFGNGYPGISLESDVNASSSVNNTLIQGNLIAGNDNHGIYAENANDLQVLSNTVGTDLTGTVPIPNSTGIFVWNTQGLTVAHNLVSGNGGSGLYLNYVTGTLIASNTIGTNRAGTAALANGNRGIYGANLSAVSVQDNLISGNNTYGIYLITATQGTVAGNKIGTDAAGTVGLGNGRPGSVEEDGVTLQNATYITVGGAGDADRNIISHNGRAGVWLDNAHNNVVRNNYIGTDITGMNDLGNGDSADGVAAGSAGIYVKDGSSSNTFQQNLIRYNYMGVRFSGEPAQGWDPPMDNDVLSNTITSNDRYGLYSEATHGNAAPFTTRSDGDNLFQGNVIAGTGSRGIGIYNHGASPHIISNTIESNAGEGIFSFPYLGTDGAANYADDLLSVPNIVSNTIRSNTKTGIVSRDTSPLNKETLLADNVFESNGGNPHISQRWFGAVEIISNSVTIDDSSSMVVTITRSGGEPPDTCKNGDCFGSTFSSDGGSNGIWGPTGIKYNDLEYDDAGQLKYTWFEIVEYEVDYQGQWITYTPQFVQADGDHLGVRSFSFDGITTTAEISGDTNLPTCVSTGILSDADHTLCRYQIVQLDVLTSDQDSDGDGIPDHEEGNDDTDGDGDADPYDADDDGDGIDTKDECPLGWPDCPDTDGDGDTDPYDPDDDGDGIDTKDECPGGGPPDNCPDTDGDGTTDPYDEDDDGDGIDTKYECPGGGPPASCPDTDGDGDSDPYDADDDGDGIPTDQENPDPNDDGNPDDAVDSDGDGIPDYKDTDSNNNGIDDGTESGLDTDGDGDVDCPPSLGSLCSTDTDGDNVDDWLDPDHNDTDGDDIPDPLDTDADGDGTSDSCEETPPAVHAPDRDCDNIPDWQDTDNDNDGITDLEELDAGTPADPECPDGIPGAHGATETDTDGDGAPDCLEEDVDDNDVPDYMENDGGCSVGDLYPDADCDGTPNHLDTDSDGDGKSDDYEYDEACGTAPPCNTDKIGPPDNIPDFLDPVFGIYLPLVLRNY